MNLEILKNIATIITSIISIFSVIILAVIKFNDIKHIDAKVNWICSDIKEIKHKQFEHEGRISKVEGRLNGL